MADAIPGARTVIFEQSAHLPMVTEKAEFLDVVRAFLDSLPS